MKAWNAKYEASGWAAVGGQKQGFRDEEDLADRKLEATEAVFNATPTTAAGRRALVEFADLQIAERDTTDGTLQDGAQTIFDRAYAALSHAVRAEIPEATSAEISLARRVIDHFGDDPIPEELDGDRAMRDAARAILAQASDTSIKAIRPPLSDFADYSINDLRRTFDALKIAQDGFGLACLDTAERLIGILDRMDGNPDDEDGGDAEPSLGAPEGHDSQVIWLRGTDRDLEA